MSCILTSGYQLGCRDAVGGVSEIYIGQYNGDALQYTLDSTGAINDITAGIVPFHKFEQELETASYNENGQFSNENGTAFFEQTLSITLHKMNSELRNKIIILSHGAWRIIIKDNMGKYWLMGHENPVRVSAATPQLGKAFGDLNGAVLTFSTKSPTPAIEITQQAASELIV